MMVCFNFFEKNSSSPFSNSNSISFSFLVRLKWFKMSWVHQLKLYFKKLYSKGKDAMIKDFMLKFLICFNSPIIEHWIMLISNNPIFSPFLYKIEQILWCWKC
jgi:hypothetical protein